MLRWDWRRLAPMVGIVFSTFTATGCSGWDASPSKAPLDIPEGCNPIAFEHDCLLPYPSDVFVVDDPSLPSGHRVALPEPTWLTNGDGEGIDPHAFYPEDGFSPGVQILVTFAQAIDDAPLVGFDDEVQTSLDDDNATLLLRADTGERILHIAELDPRAVEDTDRALVIRPLVRLQDETRYIVAIRGLTDPQGEAIPAPAGFARLRDGGASHDRLVALESRYEDGVFAPLTEAGVERSELQLAWDFTVRSRQNAIGDMIDVRAQTIAALEEGPMALSVVSVEDQPDEHTARRIEATVEVPAFLESDEPNATLLHDGDGVGAEGTFEVPFTIWIPNSVAALSAADPPARLMQFGHGFFGNRSEVDSFVVELADERGFVVVAADWWGMSSADRLPLIDKLVNEPERGLAFTDRVHQAMANFMALAAARSAIVDLPEVAELGPSPTFDADDIYFYGISQGSILGSTYLTLSPDIERGVVSVGGANLSFMLFRARPFLAFLAVLGGVLETKLDEQKFAAMLQSTFDRIDPIAYAPLLLDDPPEGAAADRRLLMQIGIGDAAVPNVSAHLLARTLGIPTLDPAPRPLPAIDTTAAPHDGSALVEFDFGIDPLPGVEAIPATSDNEVHEGVRRLEAGKEQLDRFFSPDGLIEHTCDDVCDPE